jgi:adenine-specific DNA-methyltransferase
MCATRTSAARLRPRAAALSAGVSLTGLASSWASFIVHSALFLKAGGRLGLVLPAGLLTVNYAADVRRFLMQHFRSIGLVLFVDRVFPGVQEEVPLLLAEGFDPTGTNGTDHCDIYQVQDAAALSALAMVRRWNPASARLSELQAWGDTTLGMASGNNKYFALCPTRVDELRLLPSDVIRLVSSSMQSRTS